LDNFEENIVTAELVSTIIPFLNNGIDNYVRAKAVEILQYLGKKSAIPMVLEAMVPLLRDSSLYVTDQTHITWSCLVAKMDVMAKMKIKEILFSSLSEDLNNTMVEVVDALGYLGQQAEMPEIISKIMPLLNVSNVTLRIAAVKALGFAGEKADPAEIKALILNIVPLLQNLESSVIEVAANALVNLGGKTTATPVVIQEILFVFEGSKRYATLIAILSMLEKLGEKAANPEVINLLISLIENLNLDWDIRERAVRALSALGKAIATHEIIEMLIAGLKESDANNSLIISFLAALQCIIEMSEKTEKSAVLEKIILCLQECISDETRKAICYWFVKMFSYENTTPEITKALIMLLQDKDFDIRKGTLNIFYNAGAAMINSEILEAMAPLTSDINHEVKDYAIRILKGCLNTLADFKLLLSGFKKSTVYFPEELIGEFFHMFMTQSYGVILTDCQIFWYGFGYEETFVDLHSAFLQDLKRKISTKLAEEFGVVSFDCLPDTLADEQLNQIQQASELPSSSADLLGQQSVIFAPLPSPAKKTPTQPASRCLIM
jgi:HEAT repeat protein